MQKKDTIQDKDNERDPLISYFRTLEKEVPEADIEKRWNALMQNVNREPVSKRHRYLRIYMLAAGVAALFAGIAWGTKIIYGSSFTFHRYCYWSNLKLI